MLTRADLEAREIERTEQPGPLRRGVAIALRGQRDVAQGGHLELAVLFRLLQRAAQAAVTASRMSGVAQGRGTLYRARVMGLSREAAQAACGRVRGACSVLSPNAQG